MKFTGIGNLFAAAVIFALTLHLPAFVVAQEITTDTGTIDAAKVFSAKPPYSPYAGRNFPTRPFFGDTHLHTSLSFDAGAAGCRLGPKEAYRFAKGEQVMASSGQPVKLSRPLDFLVVADHSDNMGFFTDFLAGKPELLAHPQGRKWYDMIQSGKSDQAQKAAMEIVFSFAQGKFPTELAYAPGTPGFRSTWREIVKSADEANEPGRFTAFIGYEWTSLVAGNNLHRNVIFRDDGTKANLADPDFDPSLQAFYYGRVIQIPTPRWTAYDAKHFGITMPNEVTMTTTERAYTSPIWYTPAK